LSERMKRREKWRHNVEMRYVSEYANTFYPDDIILLNQYVGTWVPVPPEADLTVTEIKMLSVRRGRADAVIITKDDIKVVEGKIRPERYADAYAKLKVYRQLIPVTPELHEYLPKPVEGILLTPIEHPVIARMAREDGLRNIIWARPWVYDYLYSLKPYLRQVPRYA